MSPTALTTPSSKRRRTAPPQQLPGATRFVEDRSDLHPTGLLRMLRQQPQFWAPLKAATDLDERFGRRRMPGHWALAYLAFVFSRHVDVEPWWRTANSSVWKEAGFYERPSLRMAQRRFAELEEHEDAFLAVAQALIAKAVTASGGLVGRDLHVDSTEAETHARLQHDCPKSSPCWSGSAPVLSATLTSDEAREHRHQEAAQPADTAPEVSGGQVERLETSSEPDPLQRRVKRVKVGGCWYRCLDADAGVRAYTRGRRTKRFWVGYYNGKAIDHYTGAPVAVLVHSASVSEAAAYPELYARAERAIGGHPRAVVADRGYSIASVFEHNTRRDVATVAQWRRRSAVMQRAQEDTDRWDRHGIVRCKHCGGPTQLVRFGFDRRRADSPEPRLWVACTEPAPGSDCEREQTILCKENWRLLLPLWRTHPTYQALRAASKSYERVHHHWRTRYRVGSDTHALRPKRRGRGCQQLRATAALVIEWFTILIRQGWLASTRKQRNHRSPVTGDGRPAASKLAALRASLGLDRPYGEVAVKLGLGPPRVGKRPPPYRGGLLPTF